MPHAGFGALAGATLAVLGQGAQVLRGRYNSSLPAMEAAAISKRKLAASAQEDANQAEALWVLKKAVEQDRRERAAMAQLQQQQAQQRAAERRQQQQEQQQQQDGGSTEMRDLGASSSSRANTSENVTGEQM